MADISITPASVLSVAGSKRTRGNAGATVEAGDVVYLDADASGEYLLADSDAAAAAARGATGKLAFALNGAGDGQPLEVHQEGLLTVGSVLTAGVTYYLSDTPGKICPLGDVTGGDYYVIVGVAVSATQLKVDFQYSGVASV